jgi:hypothetical protein
MLDFTSERAGSVLRQSEWAWVLDFCVVVVADLSRQRSSARRPLMLHSAVTLSLMCSGRLNSVRRSDVGTLRIVSPAWEDGGKIQSKVNRLFTLDKKISITSLHGHGHGSSQLSCLGSFLHTASSARLIISDRGEG